MKRVTLNYFIPSIFIYFWMRVWLLKDFEVINDNFFYIRLIFPVLIVVPLFNRLNIHNTITSFTDVVCKQKLYSIILYFVIIMLCLQFISAIRNDYIQFDTWQIYDMSQYVFTDFGKMNMIRQHILNINYEMAFPPIFPILIAFVNLFFNMGVFSSVFINFIISILTLYIMIKIGKITKNKMISVISIIVLFFNPEYKSCMLGGSTLPFGILMFFTIVWIILKYKEKLNISHIVIIATLSGLGIMNRFDFLPIACILCFSILFYKNFRINVKYFITFCIVLSIIISPWIIYSVLNFNSIFITDNGRRLFNIIDTRPSTFFSESIPAKTIFDNPVLWLRCSVLRWVSAIQSSYNYVSQYTYVKEIILVLILLIFVIQKSIIKPKLKFLNFIKSIQEYRFMFLIYLCVIGQTAFIILTGYPDARYHILFGVMVNALFIYLLIYFINRLRLKNNKESIQILIVIISVVITMTCKTQDLFLEHILYSGWKSISNGGVANSIKLSETYSDMISYLNTDSNNVRIIINRSETKIDIPEFSALSGYITMLTPSNLSKNNISEFVDCFDMKYIYTSDIKMYELFENSINIISTDIPNLYRIYE